MLKKHSQLFLSLMLVTDLLFVVSAWLLSYWVRFSFFSSPKGVPPISTYLHFIPILLIIWIVSLNVGGLYHQMRSDSRFHEYYRIFKTATISVIIMMAAAFYYRNAEFSRLVMSIFWCFSILALMISHISVRTVLRYARSKGYNLRYIAVVGTGELGCQLVEKFRKHPESGLTVVGMIADSADEVGQQIAGVPVIGSIETIDDVISKNDIDQIFIALPRHLEDRLEKTLAVLGDHTIDIKLAPDVMQFIRLNGGIEDFDGIPIVSLSESPMYGWNRILKRTFDIFFSIIFIIIASPVMLAVAIAIKIESTGPVLFRQTRMSLDGESFIILKFRSMRIDAEAETGAKWAVKDDPRRTVVGEFIRKTSLDELPQLFNVLRGDMSLVGPRPERPVFVKSFKQEIGKYMLRHKMKAGITGWAQVNGYRGNTSIEKRIEYDLYYIENWSVMLDIKILWLTLWKGFVNDHAY